MDYLRNSKEIRRRLDVLFSGDGQKWAIVGFVGIDALDHLPAPISELSVICWPKAGGTNPDGVRQLIDSGVTVYFCDRLHQKLYWKKDVGLIVGSANLSKNALGDSGLHEFAVFCDDRDFDIATVLASLKYRPVTEGELAILDVADTAYALHLPRKSVRTASRGQTFLEAVATKFPKRWKLADWSEKRNMSDRTSIAIRAEVNVKFGANKWVFDIDVKAESCEVGDFVLCVRTNDDGFVDRANARWLRVDSFIRSQGCHALVQVVKEQTVAPPFLIDAAFKRHLKTAFNASDWSEVYDKHQVVTKGFIKAIRDLYKAADH